MHENCHSKYARNHVHTYIVLGSKLLKSFALLIKVIQANFTHKSFRGVFELLSSFFSGWEGIQSFGAFRPHSHLIKSRPCYY